MVLDIELTPLEVPAGIEAVPVLDDPLLIALPYSHRLAGRSAVSLADLRDEEWMVCGVGGTCIDSNVVLRAAMPRASSPASRSRPTTTAPSWAGRLGAWGWR